MWPCPHPTGNLTDIMPSHYQRIGNERPMASPRNRLGTHQDRRLLPGKLDATYKVLDKLRRLHVVGITSEPGIPPTDVD